MVRLEKTTVANVCLNAATAALFDQELPVFALPAPHFAAHSAHGPEFGRRCGFAMEVTVQRHCVPSDPQSGLSPLQSALLESPQRVRVVSAPTGAGKSYAFLQALLQKDEHVFVCRSDSTAGTKIWLWEQWRR